MSLKLLVKIFDTQCFFNDYLNYKTANETTYRTPSVNPCPTMDLLDEKIWNCGNYFLRFSGFSDLSGKVFLITFKFS